MMYLLLVFIFELELRETGDRFVVIVLFERFSGEGLTPRLFAVFEFGVEEAVGFDLEPTLLFGVLLTILTAGADKCAFGGGVTGPISWLSRSAPCFCMLPSGMIAFIGPFLFTTSPVPFFFSLALIGSTAGLLTPRVDLASDFFLSAASVKPGSLGKRFFKLNR